MGQLAWTIVILCIIVGQLKVRFQFKHNGWVIMLTKQPRLTLKPHTPTTNKKKQVVTPNIFSGIFWYFFPASCIMVNDIMAYLAGGGVVRVVGRVMCVCVCVCAGAGAVARVFACV